MQTTRPERDFLQSEVWEALQFEQSVGGVVVVVGVGMSMSSVARLGTVGKSGRFNRVSKDVYTHTRSIKSPSPSKIIKNQLLHHLLSRASRLSIHPHCQSGSEATQQSQSLHPSPGNSQTRGGVPKEHQKTELQSLSDSFQTHSLLTGLVRLTKGVGVGPTGERFGTLGQRQLIRESESIHHLL